jgi:hypothetical protein
MITEKEQIERILKNRGILVNGVFNTIRFKKLVTEPWIHNKTKEYGFDKMTEEISQPVDNEPVIEENIEKTTVETVVEPIVEEQPVEEVVEEVKEEQPVEEVVEEQPVEEVVEEVKEEQPKKKTTKKK